MVVNIGVSVFDSLEFSFHFDIVTYYMVIQIINYDKMILNHSVDIFFYILAAESDSTQLLKRGANT